MRQNWPKEAPIPVERHDTIRRKIASLLLEGPRTARDLALDLRIPEKEIYDHLEHIRKTTHKGERRLSMEPAVCERVCRAWHRTYGVKVPVPGFSGAEGKEKGNGVVARRGLKEAQSETAGRRTGTGSEVWYTRDERARDREVLHPHRGCAL
jgi:predicted Zn-ribbon and HTH transcriptional regulator